MDSWFENTVLQGTYTNGKWAPPPQHTHKLLKLMNPGKMPLKTTGKYYFTILKWLKLKGQILTSVNMDVE